MNLLLLTLLTSTTAAATADAPYVISIGVNQGTGQLSELRFADDDAARAAALLGASGRRSALHTLLDADSAGRYPELHKSALPPTRDALLRSVERMADMVEDDIDEGRKPHVVIWISGHGAFDDEGHAYIPLGQDRLRPRDIVELLVEPLSIAHRVHLVVDTCFAGALVKSRALVKSVEPEEAEAAFDLQSVRAFPNVGVLLGSSASAESFEWERVRGGVFSALLRSAVRGLADVDQDREVTYDELEAFLAAATIGLRKTGAAQRFEIWRPTVDPSSTFFAQSWLGDTKTVDASFGKEEPFMMYDAQGQFVLGGNIEDKAKVDLWLPRGQRFYVQTANREVLLSTEGQANTVLDAQSQTVVRGRIDDALRKGLFSTSYGPRFFAGYAARSSLAPSDGRVAFGAEGGSAPEDPAVAHWAFYGVGAGLGVAAVVAGAVSVGGFAVFVLTDRQVPAYTGFVTGAAAGGVAAVALGGAALAGVTGLIIHE